MRTIVLDLPLPADEMHQNARVDWRTVARAQARDKKTGELVAKAALKGRTPPRWPRARLFIHFRFPNRRARDLLNYAAAIKGLLDGVVEAGILADDKCTVLEHIGGITWEANRENVGVTLRFVSLAQEVRRAA